VDGTIAAPPAAAANTTVSQSDPEFSELSYSGGSNESWVILQVKERSSQAYTKFMYFFSFSH
jgi:hypothetical protein